jgi:hypothetical protein
MQNHEETLQDQFTNLLAIFRANFPSVDPPASHWWLLWMQKYEFADILTAIQNLGRHSFKAKFTTESTGRALSTLLRDAALRRVILGAPKPGGPRSCAANR